MFFLPNIYKVVFRFLFFYVLSLNSCLSRVALFVKAQAICATLLTMEDFLLRSSIANVGI